MGSKSPDGHQQTPENGSSGGKPAAIVATAKTPKSGRDDGQEDDEGGEDDGDEDDQDASGLMSSVDNARTKKKRKRSKKKKKAAVQPKQSFPPRVLISTLFPSGIYPESEMLKYADENTVRTTAEELRHNDRMDDTFLNDYRQAAEVHRQVRQWAQKSARPGQTLVEIAEGIEDGVRALTGHQGLEKGDSLKAGMGFPTGICLNNIAAHYTPNPGGKQIILQKEDVVTIDFGVHVNGRIVDSAFTMAFDPVYDNLLASVKDATNTGVKTAGIDVRMSDIGAAIQEVMESYEVEIKGRTYPVKAIRNLTGHDILQYHIHGGKQIPFIKNSNQTKMEEGEVFAIETFGSTGTGYMHDDVGLYGYGRNTNASTSNLHLASAKSLLKKIDENYGSIVFCRRYLERLGIKNYLFGMSNLVSNGIVDTYAPLSDIKGSYVAQFEHTILLRSSGKEVISRGDDY